MYKLKCISHASISDTLTIIKHGKGVEITIRASEKDYTTRLTNLGVRKVNSHLKSYIGHDESGSFHVGAIKFDKLMGSFFITVCNSEASEFEMIANDFSTNELISVLSVYIA